MARVQGQESRGRRARRCAIAGRCGAVLAAAMLAGACALGPDFQRPAAPGGDRLVDAQRPRGPLAADGREQRFDPQAEVPARWWQGFGSPVLDAAVDAALAGSPDLQAGQARLRQSAADLQAGYGVFFPQLGASALAERQSAVVDLGHGPVSTGAYTVGTLGATVSYVPDLFGGQRRTVEALGARLDGQRYAVLATYLSLTANVVNTVIARAAYADQQAAALDLVRLQDEQIRLAQAQVSAGTTPYAAVLSLRSQRAVNAAAAAALEQRGDAALHLLAQLSGTPPARFAAPALHLDALVLPAGLPDALPATLARRRPDVLAAEANLHVASANIGVATAQLFPSLTLGGTAGTSHDAIGELLRAGTRYWSAQAELAGSLFSGGSQWYARKSALAAYDAALYQYEATVLAALDQVADVMRALEHDAQILAAQSDGLAAATENARLVEAGYTAGSAGYVDLLAANAQLAQARNAYLGAVAQRLQDTVALYAALGGGWWGADAPPAARAAAAGVVPAGTP